MALEKKLIARSEVIRILGLQEEFLVALEREEIVVTEGEGHYAPAMVERIRICHSLHADLGVNLAGLEVALGLLETIREERDQFHQVLTWLKSQLPRPPGDSDR